MDSSKIDAILSAWTESDELLSYSQIKQHLVDKKIINETNDSSPTRWLKKLVADKYLKKEGNNGYVLNTEPNAYKVFDYINEVRKKYEQYIYEGEVGKTFSHVCANTYLNFDELLIKKIDEQLAFDLISVRLGELFGALYQLKNDILKRRCGLEPLELNDVVIREVFFALLNRSIGTHNATEELVSEYEDKLRKIETKQFEMVWEKNKPNHVFHQLDFLANGFGFDDIEEDPEGYKKFLKNDCSLDIEKYTVEELLDKYKEINDWIERNHKDQLKNDGHYSLTPQEMEGEHNYRTAILVKVAECIKALDTSTEDFAVILTRHPQTMNQFFKPEHILHEAMVWACKPPEVPLLKNFWQEIKDQEKTFEGMVAENIVGYPSLTPKVIESLRTKPWVKRELSKYGSFDEILRLYKLKLKKKLKQDAKDANRIFGMVERICEESANMRNQKNNNESDKNES